MPKFKENRVSYITKGSMKIEAQKRLNVLVDVCIFDEAYDNVHMGEDNYKRHNIHKYQI